MQVEKYFDVKVEFYKTNSARKNGEVTKTYYIPVLMTPYLSTIERAQAIKAGTKDDNGNKRTSASAAGERKQIMDKVFKEVQNMALDCVRQTIGHDGVLVAYEPKLSK